MTLWGGHEWASWNEDLGSVGCPGSRHCWAPSLPYLSFLLQHSLLLSLHDCFSPCGGTITTSLSWISHLTTSASGKGLASFSTSRPELWPTLGQGHCRSYKLGLGVGEATFITTSCCPGDTWKGHNGDSEGGVDRALCWKQDSRHSVAWINS